MDSWLVFRRDRVILNQWTKGNDWSLKWFSKTLSYGVFPSDKRSCMFQRQQWHSMESADHFSSRPDCNSTTDVPSLILRECSLSNPICSWSVWCWRTVIPRKIFTRIAKFQGIVSVNDFWLPRRLQELLQALLRFLSSFCFARIRLDPLGSKVLHHDCISMIVLRFTTFTENFVIGCNQFTKIFCTMYDSANTSSARSPCDFGPLAHLAISVFREVSINTVLTQIHTSLEYGL